MTMNERVLAIARTWIGTPYVHQASTRKQGTDCLGLILGIYREIHGFLPEAVPDYAADWGEVSGNEVLLSAASRHFSPVARQHIQPGHLLVFRWRSGATAKHLGIMSNNNRFIHAYERAGVIESPLGGNVRETPADVHGQRWRNRIAGAFCFPGSSSMKPSINTV